MSYIQILTKNALWFRRKIRIIWEKCLKICSTSQIAFGGKYEIVLSFCILSLIIILGKCCDKLILFSQKIFIVLLVFPKTLALPGFWKKTPFTFNFTYFFSKNVRTYIRKHKVSISSCTLMFRIFCCSYFTWHDWRLQSESARVEALILNDKVETEYELSPKKLGP